MLRNGIILAGLSIALLLSCSLEEKVEFDHLNLIVMDKTSVGDTTIINFPFKNIGDQPLTITEIIPLCGCTTGLYSEYTPSNSEGAVTLVFVPSPAMRGKKVRRTAQVFTTKGEFQLVFIAEVAK